MSDRPDTKFLVAAVLARIICKGINEIFAVSEKIKVASLITLAVVPGVLQGNIHLMVWQETLHLPVLVVGVVAPTHALYFRCDFLLYLACIVVSQIPPIRGR